MMMREVRMYDCGDGVDDKYDDDVDAANDDDCKFVIPVNW